MSDFQAETDIYGAQYGNFTNDLVEQVRREAFGEDIGQTGWLTSQEQDRFIDMLGLTQSDHLLDVACGSAHPTMRIARKTGCSIEGVDINARAIEAARRGAAAAGLSERAQFHVIDGREKQDFEAEAFSVVTCIDAINHLLDRKAVLLEWHRLLKPGGSLLFTDPIVLTGPITKRELEIRFSIGQFLLVPSGVDEDLLDESGFELIWKEDSTINMAKNARGWFQARAKHEVQLRDLEGNDRFEDQQLFLDTTALLAEEKRLSRHSFLAKKR